MSLASALRTAVRITKRIVMKALDLITDVFVEVVDTTEWAAETEEGQATVGRVLIIWQLLDQVLASLLRRAARRQRRRPRNTYPRMEPYRWPR